MLAALALAASITSTEFVSDGGATGALYAVVDSERVLVDLSVWPFGDDDQVGWVIGDRLYYAQGTTGEGVEAEGQNLRAWRDGAPKRYLGAFAYQVVGVQEHSTATGRKILSVKLGSSMAEGQGLAFVDPSRGVLWNAWGARVAEVESGVATVEAGRFDEGTGDFFPNSTFEVELDELLQGPASRTKVQPDALR